MADDRDDETPYTVGYGKPPQETRFKRGKSGNPRGRPRGVRDLKSELTEELLQPVAIREGGKRKTVSKQRAILKRLVEQSLSGDVRATRELFSLSIRMLTVHGDGDETDTLPDNDLALINDFLARATPKDKNKVKRRRKSVGKGVRQRKSIEPRGPGDGLGEPSP